MSNWYISSKQLGLFDAPQSEPQKPPVMEKPEKKPGLQVDVEVADNWGRLVLWINGKRYEYQCSFPTSDIRNKFNFYKEKGWGKRIKDMIDWLDRYRVKT
jgi:hypothetical protein